MSKMDAVLAACDAMERRVDAMENARADEAWAKKDGLVAKGPIESGEALKGHMKLVNDQ